MLGKEYRGYLTSILDKCTALDPQKRYSSVAALKRDVLQKKRKIPRRVLLYVCCAAILGAVFYVSKIAADNIAITPPAVSITAPAAEAPQEQPPPNSAENASAANSIAKNSIFENSIAENSIVETKIRNDLPKPEHDSVTTLPAAAEIAPLPEQIAAQPMAANFSVNGKSLSSFQTGIIRLNREEWPTYAADLHVENNGNITWDNPQIRIVFSDNWEKKYTETKSLPSVAPGKTADFSIPVGTYPVTKHDDT